jgi:hypothetical protein
MTDAWSAVAAIGGMGIGIGLTEVGIRAPGSRDRDDQMLPKVTKDYQKLPDFHFSLRWRPASFYAGGLKEQVRAEWKVGVT